MAFTEAGAGEGSEAVRESLDVNIRTAGKDKVVARTPSNIQVQQIMVYLQAQRDRLGTVVGSLVTPFTGATTLRRVEPREVWTCDFSRDSIL